MEITVFGTGYVGLVQAAILAEAGHHVLCVDVDAHRIEGLRRGIVPIYEPGLEPIIAATHADGRLTFSTDAAEGVRHGVIQFIAVGTPLATSGGADLSYVQTVAKTIAAKMDGYKCIVTKSTVPVGTADKIKSIISSSLAERDASYEFDVVSNPEFLKEGAAVIDCQRPDRIVIGTDSARAEKLLREVYAPYNRNHDKIIVMDVRSAELTKYAANCMLATKISFMNEMANLAESLNADIEAVRKGIGSDPRIGYHFIYPGAGYGGSCFPKDVQALIHTAEEIGLDPWILKAVENRNKTQKQVLFNKIKNYFHGNLKGKTIAIWGLSFKPNTDDMREAPSRTLMEAIWHAGGTVKAYDPKAMDEVRRIYGTRPDLVLGRSKEAVLDLADALVVITEWQEFRAPDFAAIRKALRYPVIFDGRNIYDPAVVAGEDITLFSIGRDKRTAKNEYRS